MKPLLTTEIFSIPYDGAFVVYAPRRRVAFIADAETVNVMAQLQEGALAQPTAAQTTLLEFLQAVHVLGAEGDLPIQGLGQAEYKPVEVTLFLTGECNLRCVYCYARAGDIPTERMALPTAQRGIDYVVANALEVNTGWFALNYHGGGEPTLNHHVLTRSHAYARERAAQHGLAFYSSIATNGVLAPRARQWIIENLNGASVSLDGAPAVNDTQRPTVGGYGSATKVLETLRAFDDAGFKYGVRITVTPQSVGAMADTVRFILEHAQPARLQIEPVYDIGRGENVTLHVEPQPFIEGYRASWQLAHAYGIELDYSSARIDMLTSRFCGAYGEGFSLTPQGNVSGCFEVYDEQADFADDVIFGNFDERINRYVFDEKKLERLRAHNVHTQSWCDGCFAKWHCAGDCPNKTRHAAGDGEFQGMPSCEITRSIVLDQILRKVHDAGGIIWLEQRRVQ